jgi:PAS domain S-box-containing protein
MAKKPTYEALEQRVKELEKVEAERKQAEDTLRENEEKYRTLVEGLEDVIVSFSLDGTILYCSPNVNNFGGYDSKEEIGHHFSKYIADEEVKQELQEFFQGIIKRKKTITFPIINEKTDEIVSIQCIVRDITERKQAEEELRKYRDHLEELVEERTAELREIEERFSAFMDYLPAIVFIKDENYRMEYMNKHMRDVLGTDDSWMGRTILEILGDTDLARKMIANDKIALSAGFKLKEESVSGAAGTERLYETRKFRIDRKGKSPLLGGIALDITERKQAEEKEKEHHKNIQLLSNTAMKFVEFPADKNIYNFIGEQLRELIGKDSYIVINAIDEEKSILTTRTVLGLGKLSDKVAGLLGKHPVGMTFNAKDEELVYHLSDGKLHLNEEGLYGMLLKTVPKTVCNSIEKKNY